MRFKNIIWFSLILILLVSGCQLSANSNVEIVVQENNLSYWYLSPSGDYIIYGAPRGKNNFLLDLTTGQEHDFDCELLWWDNYLIGCSKPHDLSVIDAKTTVKTALSEIDLTKPLETGITQEDVEEIFLMESELIYRPEWVTDTIYILASNYQLNPEKNYVIKGLIKADKLLDKYTYKLVPPKLVSDPYYEKTFSPNGLYYYNPPTRLLAIFTTDNDQKVVEFLNEDSQHLDVLGWASDSSGVYFITYGVGFLTTDLPKTIRKLKIPDN